MVTNHIFFIADKLYNQGIKVIALCVVYAGLLYDEHKEMKLLYSIKRNITN